MTQTTEHVVMQPHTGNPTIYQLGQNSRVVRFARDFSALQKRASWFEYQTLYLVH